MYSQNVSRISRILRKVCDAFCRDRLCCGMTPSPWPDAPLAVLLGSIPVSAGPFVVTLYGDVVAPRGGEVWMGTLIATCAVVGIAESRVRTAVSRLVAAGRIAGEKLGRRSYYRLTPDAEREFAQAAALIYAPADPPPLRAWHLVALRRPDRDAAARTLDPAALRPRAAAARPAPRPRAGASRAAGAPFLATTEADLAPLVADAWPLAAIAAAMRRFLDGFRRSRADASSRPRRSGCG